MHMLYAEENVPGVKILISSEKKQNKIMGVIKSLFEKWACKHEWEKWDVVNVTDDFGGRYTVTHFVCKKCGKFKKVKCF